MPFAAAICKGCAAPTVRKSWARRIAVHNVASITIAQPMRHPVTLYVLETLFMVTVRSAIPGREAILRWVSPSKMMCSYGSSEKTRASNSWQSFGNDAEFFVGIDLA